MNRPVMDASSDNPEWLIHEDWALLQCIQSLQELPLQLMTNSPAHIPNWDLVADVVNASSRTYRYVRPWQELQFHVHKSKCFLRTLRMSMISICLCTGLANSAKWGMRPSLFRGKKAEYFTTWTLVNRRKRRASTRYTLYVSVSCTSLICSFQLQDHSDKNFVIVAF